MTATRFGICLGLAATLLMIARPIAARPHTTAQKSAGDRLPRPTIPVSRSAPTAGAHMILASEVGLRGDGVTDNASTFDAVRAEMLAHPAQLNVLVLERGAIYRSSRNRWLTGVKRWRIVGNGATLRETGGSQERWWYTNSGSFEGSPSEAMTRKGELIANVEVGAHTVRLLRLSDAAKYAHRVGSRVLIYGCNAYEGGYPPDPKYFEWNVIAAVDVPSGTVTVLAPLRFTYRQDWPENPAKTGTDAIYASGRARIRLMSGDGFTETEYGEISDLTVTGTADALGGVLLVNGAKEVVIQNVKTDTFIPSVAESIRTRGLEAHFMEGDKIVDRLTMIGGRIGDVAECLGIRWLRFTGVRFEGKWLSRPHHLSVRDCDFYGAGTIGAERHQAFVNARNGITVEFRGNRFHPPSQGALTWNTVLPADAVWPTIAAGSFTVGAVDGPSTIEGVGQDSVAVVMSVRPGLQFVVKNKDLRGRFKSVRASARSPYPTVQVDVERSGTASFAVGDVIQIPTHEQMLFRDNVLDSTRAQNLRLAPLEQPVAWDMNGLSTAVSHCDFAHPSHSYFVGGYLRDLEVRVERPYTGPDRAPLLVLEKVDSPGDARQAIVDLSQAGLRKMTLSAAFGTRGGDRLARLRAAQWNSLRWQTARNGSNGDLTGTAEQLPVVSIRFVRAALP